MLGESSFFKSFLDEYGGIGIVWEHRFVLLHMPRNAPLNELDRPTYFLTTDTTEILYQWAP
jgi:hypothetical protein